MCKKRTDRGQQVLKRDTMLWKKRHKKRTRLAVYKSVTKHFILSANVQDWKVINHYYHIAVAE